MTNREKHYEILTKIWERGDNFGINKKNGTVISCHDSRNKYNCTFCKFNATFATGNCIIKRKEWLEETIDERRSVRSVVEEELQHCLDIHCADCPYWIPGQTAKECQAKKISDAILDAFDKNLLLRKDR